MTQIDEYRRKVASLSPDQTMEWAAREFGVPRLVIASSLGAEDQVLTHLASRMVPEIRVFTLDTGRLFQESYDLIEKTRNTMGVTIHTYFPDPSQVEEMVQDRGVNLFYKSVDDRKRCCHVRKVEPLRRALSGMSAWIVGLRREQAVTRQGLETVEWDEPNGMYKI
ncbi:MAG: phosphoadenylyl-sulfate reductase, partial [Spirochaetales bacterium]